MTPTARWSPTLFGQASPRDGPGLVEEVAASVQRLAGSAARPGRSASACPAWWTPPGTVRFAPNLPGLAGTPLSDALGAALPGWSVWVGNDATAACWGEHAVGRPGARTRS